MRRRAIVLCLVAVMAAAVAVAACSSSRSGSTGGACTPPPAQTVTFNFTMQNAQPQAGHVAALRFLQNNQIVYTCTTALVPASGTWTASDSAFGPISPNLELILNSGAEAAFGSGDQHFAFHAGTDGTLVGDACSTQLTWNVTFDYATAVQSPVLWETGYACPGTPP